jgi:GTP-binding protein
MTEKKLPQVAIIGRTNIGKSTLFNALLQRRLSVVDDSAGVTRDRHYGVLRQCGINVSLVDTGGLVSESEATALDHDIRQQAQLAAAESDLILAVFDGLAGPHPLDYEVVDYLRRLSKPVIWVVNKCEKPETAQSASEFYAMGIDEFYCVSAAHRIGLRDVIAGIATKLSLSPDLEGVKEEQALEGDAAEEALLSDSQTLDELAEGEEEKSEQVDPDRPICIAIIGKPNVGKSSLINMMVGSKRVITGDIAGTTTDSVDVPLRREGRDYVVVDTAGLRKKARIEDQTVERYSNLRTLRSIARSDVVVLVLDATLGAPSEQDCKIAGIAHDRGKGLVIVVNKWDAVEKNHKSVRQAEDLIYSQMGFAKYAPILFISALTGRRCPSVLDVAARIYDQRRQRIPTSELNRVVKQALSKWAPAVHRGEPIRVFFATQVSVAPPRIVVFVNNLAKLAMSYQRYLKNEIRAQFPFEGCDIKLDFRKRTSKTDARVLKKAS